MEYATIGSWLRPPPPHPTHTPAGLLRCMGSTPLTPIHSGVQSSEPDSYTDTSTSGARLAGMALDPAEAPALAGCLLRPSAVRVTSTTHHGATCSLSCSAAAMPYLSRSWQHGHGTAAASGCKWGQQAVATVAPLPGTRTCLPQALNGGLSQLLCV